MLLQLYSLYLSREKEFVVKEDFCQSPISLFILLSFSINALKVNEGEYYQLCNFHIHSGTYNKPFILNKCGYCKNKFVAICVYNSLKKGLNVLLGDKKNLCNTVKPIADETFEIVAEIYLICF